MTPELEYNGVDVAPVGGPWLYKRSTGYPIGL